MNMQYYEVAPNRIIRNESSTFTYASKQPLAIGQLVRIEIGKQTCTGVIIKRTKRPSYATKPIQALLETDPLPEPLVRLALWMSNYYATHLATVLQTLLPRGLEKNPKTKATTSCLSGCS